MEFPQDDSKYDWLEIHSKITKNPSPQMYDVVLYVNSQAGIL